MTYQVNGSQQELYAFSTHRVKLSEPSCWAALLSALEDDRTDLFHLFLFTDF